MTLKEKFGNLELDDPYIFMREYDTEECEKIAENFAIGFAEWAYRNDYNIGFYFKQDTTKELLEIYKKEKGL